VDCYGNKKSDVACLGRKLKPQLIVYIIDWCFISNSISTKYCCENVVAAELFYIYKKFDNVCCNNKYFFFSQ
jgi:hypothetical protein